MPFPVLPRLETERLLLRTVEKNDLPALLAINSNDDVTRYLPYASWSVMADAQAWYECIRERHEKGSTMQFVVIEKQADAVIGSCLLFNLDETNAYAEAGYLLGKPYWGNGYMHEAMSALIDYAFNSLQLRRLEAMVDPRNVASDRLLTRLGFTREGRMRERWVKDGEIQDCYFYGLLRREWPLRAAT